MSCIGLVGVAATALAVGCGGHAATGPAPRPPTASALDATNLTEAERALAASDKPLATAPSVPMSLTASDGTGLRLRQLTARAVVEEPLAFTELHLTFDNPEDRTLEGTFKITLPQGATVSRFAMKIGDVWQEGEVVELQAAREAYEDFLHRRQDPALLEQAAGNEFTARVFPIPARGAKEVVVSYSQEIDDARPYTLPLKGLPELGGVDVQVSIPNLASAKSPKDADAMQVLKETKWTPTADFKLESKHVKNTFGLRAGNFVLTRVHPETTSHPDPLGDSVILFDTSASRALGFDDQLRLLTRIVARVAASSGAKTKVTIACFDQTVDPIFDGEAGAFSDKDVQRIKERGALGASNLEQALRWAHDQAKKKNAKRVVLVTDGVATAGSIEADKLRTAAAELKDAGVERLDAVTVGGIRDDATLRRLATAGLLRDGVVVDGASTPEQLARRLGEATKSGIEVKVDGATWQYPKKLDGVQAGDEVFVYAEVPAAQAVKVSVAGAPARGVELMAADRPLLERAWAQAKIASLVDRSAKEDGPRAADTKKQIIDLSVSRRVLSPYTGLLVLETEEDYARFKIDRRALADVLTVDNGRIALTKRAGTSARIAQNEGPADWNRNASDDRKKKDEDKSVQSESPATKAPQAQAPRVSAAPPPPTTPAPEPVASSSNGPVRSVAPGGAPMMEAAKPAPPREERPPSAPPAARPSPAPAATSAARATRPSRPSPDSADPFSADLSSAMGQGTGGGGGGSASGSVRGTGAREGRDDGIANEAPEKENKTDPYTGKFKAVMDAIAKKDAKRALEIAKGWHAEDPGDVMGLVALGEAHEANGGIVTAGRAYGSLVDLFPSRADLRRFAGERLEHLKDSAGLDLAIDSFTKARDQRPDHPASHRLLAYAQLRKGQHAKAFETLAAGVKRRYPSDRFLGADRILREDLGLVGAAWMKAEPSKREEILQKVRDAGGTVEGSPSLRFVLNWETDANDVDFHIFDSKGGHAYFSSPHLGSGGDLYADVTTGYGPECFTIRGARRAGPYVLQAHYYSRGPMGYGMGKLEIIEHDGKGGITFEERPFVVMVDQAFVDLGTVNK
ncbi:MAG: putative signal peptide protein [Myxococcaceae bacterium]|nr:putative signal peptide protein [Myxococcaceae bacterium]